MRVAVAQTKPVTGDLEGNVRQILEDINRAKASDTDVLLFPETAITGYCCGALYENEEFVAANKSLLEDIIAKEIPEDMVAVVGFVDIKGRRADGYLNITNSAAVLQGGRVVDIYDKTLLANGNHHEDKKYFTAGTDVKVTRVNIKGKDVTIGTPICEDAWNTDHTRDIVQEMVDLGAELILSPNQSYFYHGKQELRYDLFGSHARENGVPVFVANAAGVGDIVKNILIYDGSSFGYNAEGELVTQLDRFSRDLQVVDLESAEPVPHLTPTKYEELYEALKFEQKELFDVIGIPNAQVHVSGGIDSAVGAVLTADAMGIEHTILISNPTEDNKEQTRSDAQYIADQLGATLYWESTQELYKAAVESHTKAHGKEPTMVGKGSMQAVLRTAQASGAGHTYRSGVVACGNHTEIVEGWASFHDIGSIGVHAPIGDLTKMEVFQLAAYINELHGKEIIPKHLYDGTTQPAAELADSAEDPLDYWVRSGIDAELIRNRQTINGLVGAYRSRTLTEDFFPLDPHGKSVYERYDEAGFTEQVIEAYNNSKRSVFKAAQAAPIVIISPRSRGFSNRETIINHFDGWYSTDQMKKRLGVAS